MSIRQFISPRALLNQLRNGERFTTETITVIVIPSRGARPRQFVVPRFILYVLLGAGAFSLLCLFAFLLWSGRVLFDAHDARTLRSQVATLTRENSRIIELEHMLREMRDSQQKILAWAGMPPVAPAVQDDLAALGAAPDSAGATSPADTVDSAAADSLPRLAPVPGARRAGWRWPVTGWISHRFATGDSASGGAGNATDFDGVHPGVDIVSPRDTPVLAASAGVVTFAGWDDELGNMITIEHPSGISTTYGHNAALLVSAGAHVVEGQPIARVGSTGRSSAPHLHFEVRYARQAIDPEQFLSGEWKVR